MSNKDVIGVVGQGFVGGSITGGMKEHFVVETYDKYVEEKSTCSSLGELCGKSEIIFVCLPTPMRKSGECDVSIIDGVLSEINQLNLGNLVVIKSTVPVGTSRKFSEKYPNINVVFNPEFLREKTALEDFQNQNRIILGGDNKHTMIVAMMYVKVFQPPDVKYVHTTYEVAEMTKYMTNTFLSTVISYANEIYDICDALGIDYEEVRKCAVYDERLAKAPLMVPGPDDKMRFFGGHCFPKDLNALMFLARSLGVRHDILKASWDECLDGREVRDWEQMKGRAVSENDYNESDLEYLRNNLSNPSSLPKDLYIPPEDKKDWYINKLRVGDKIRVLDKYGYGDSAEFGAIFSHLIKPEGEGEYVIAEVDGKGRRLSTACYLFYNKERDVNGMRVVAEGK